MTKTAQQFQLRANSSIVNSINTDLAFLVDDFAICKQMLTKLNLPTVPTETSQMTGQKGVDSAVHDLTTSKDHVSSMTNENSKPLVSDFLYGKLNYPAEKLLGTLPHTDGFDIEKLIKLLKVALSLCRMYPDIKRNIISVLLPYAQGSLNSCLLKHSVFSDFHREVLQNFIPSKRHNTLEQELLYRPQGQRESLHQFVHDIKEVAQVLLINKNEKEITELILEALSPEVRNCLVFASKPQNFDDLDGLCAQVNNTLFIYRERQVQETREIRSEREFRPFRSTPVCHRCGQRGHISPQCRNSTPSSANFNRPY